MLITTASDGFNIFKPSLNEFYTKEGEEEIEQEYENLGMWYQLWLSEQFGNYKFNNILENRIYYKAGSKSVTNHIISVGLSSQRVREAFDPQVLSGHRVVYALSSQWRTSRIGRPCWNWVQIPSSSSTWFLLWIFHTPYICFPDPRFPYHGHPCYNPSDWVWVWARTLALAFRLVVLVSHIASQIHLTSPQTISSWLGFLRNWCNLRFPSHYGLVEPYGRLGSQSVLEVNTSF